MPQDHDPETRDLSQLPDFSADETGATEPPPGTPKAERYAFLEVLGRGGQASVYRAKQLATGREVAVKVLESVAAGHGQFTQPCPWTEMRESRHLGIGHRQPRR